MDALSTIVQLEEQIRSSNARFERLSFRAGRGASRREAAAANAETAAADAADVLLANLLRARGAFLDRIDKEYRQRQPGRAALEAGQTLFVADVDVRIVDAYRTSLEALAARDERLLRLYDEWADEPLPQYYNVALLKEMRRALAFFGKRAKYERQTDVREEREIKGSLRRELLDACQRATIRWWLEDIRADAQSRPQDRVLAAVREHPDGLSRCKLEKLLHMKHGSAAPILTRLCELGDIVRRGGGPRTRYCPR